MKHQEIMFIMCSIIVIAIVVVVSPGHSPYWWSNSVAPSILFCLISIFCCCCFLSPENRLKCTMNRWWSSHFWFPSFVQWKTCISFVLDVWVWVECLLPTGKSNELLTEPIGWNKTNAAFNWLCRSEATDTEKWNIDGREEDRFWVGFLWSSSINRCRCRSKCVNTHIIYKWIGFRMQFDSFIWS